MQMKRWRQLMTGVVLAAWALAASAVNVGDKAPEFAAPSSTGKEINVAKKDIAERRQSDTSLMPENFGELLSADEFNHLMAYLLAKKAQP